MTEQKRTKPQTLRQYQRFYREIAKLTLNHSVLRGNAVVYANQLGDALMKVDPMWWERKK